MSRWQPEITMETFESVYRRASHIDQDYYNRWFITLPCNCGEQGCRGWAAIGRNWDAIQHQLGFYLPDKDDLIHYFPEVNPPHLEGE